MYMYMYMYAIISYMYDGIVQPQPFICYMYMYVLFSQLTEDLHQVLVEKQELLQQLRHDSTQELMTNLTQLNQKEQTLVSESLHKILLHVCHTSCTCTLLIALDEIAYCIANKY